MARPLKIPAKPSVLVLTTCSAGKRCRTVLRAESLARADQAAVAAAWKSLLCEEQVLTPANRVYKGRAFQLALGAATRLRGELGIVSAGLGYVKSDTKIPAYDLTVRPVGPGSVRMQIDGEFDPLVWWRAVESGPFSGSLARDLAGRRLVLACLSRGYSEMVGADLARFAAKHPSSLRLFGLSLDSALPDALKPFVLPYDARLETAEVRGTRVDFPQRALLDYLTYIAPHSDGTIEGDAGLVSERLSQFDRPKKRVQRRVDDDVVKEWIARAAPDTGRSVSDLLDRFRNDAGLSCEQGRFRNICRQVFNEERPS